MGCFQKNETDDSMTKAQVNVWRQIPNLGLEFSPSDVVGCRLTNRLDLHGLA
jgi:hypothetical protein